MLSRLIGFAAEAAEVTSTASTLSTSVAKGAHDGVSAATKFIVAAPVVAGVGYLLHKVNSGQQQQSQNALLAAAAMKKQAELSWVPIQP